MSKPLCQKACLALLLLFIGCGSPSYIKTDTNPFFKSAVKDRYKIYVVIPFEATIEDKKASKNLMDVISAYNNCRLTENVREADLFVQILASSRTYQVGTSSGYTFQFPSMSQYTFINSVAVKELLLVVYSSERLPGRTVKFNNIVWTGFIRTPRQDFIAHPKTFIHVLFSKFGGADVDSGMDILYNSYID